MDIQAKVDELPRYRLLLACFKGYKPSMVGQARVSGGGSEGSTPLNISVVDLIDAVNEILSTINGVRVRDLIMLSWGVPEVLNARRIHGKAAAVCGLERRWERRRAKCPECRLPTLGQFSGDDRIQCTNSACATTLSKSEYEDYCKKEATNKNGRRKNHN